MKEKKSKPTQTEVIRCAWKSEEDQTVWNEFMNYYVEFLCSILRRGGIWGGRGLCVINTPQENREEIIEELRPLIFEVCLEFLKTKVTSEFLDAIHRTHQGTAERHVSVRTTLQYMLVNKLKRNPCKMLIVKFSPRSIDLYLKDAQGGLGRMPLPPCKEEIRELLRRFRIMLTRMAGKGDVSVYPTGYECYCLYHDCFGSDREKIIRTFVQNPEEQNRLLEMQFWNDAAVGSLLSDKYQGKIQHNGRKVSCERKTVNNRRRAYQELLLKCLLDCMPDADRGEAERMLDRRNADGEEVVEFFSSFIRSMWKRNPAMKSDDVRHLEKDRTLESVR